EYVAQNSPDAGCRTLIGLDERGVVVALHLENAGESIADVDDTRVLARALDDPRCFRRQAAQMRFRGFVGAMLVPHRRNDAELGEARIASDQLAKALVFVGLQPVLGDKLWRDLRSVGDHQAASSVSIKLSNRRRPSVGPTTGSTGFSGCGISPRTFRFSDKMPAIGFL